MPNKQDITDMVHI